MCALKYQKNTNTAVCSVNCTHGLKINIHFTHLQSSLSIVIVACPVLPTVTPVGSEDGSTSIVNVSLSSKVLSSFIVMSNGALVPPAGIVTVYGPAT